MSNANVFIFFILVFICFMYFLWEILSIWNLWFKFYLLSHMKIVIFRIRDIFLIWNIFINRILSLYLLRLFLYLSLEMYQAPRQTKISAIIFYKRFLNLCVSINWRNNINSIEYINLNNFQVNSLKIFQSRKLVKHSSKIWSSQKWYYYINQWLANIKFISSIRIVWIVWHWNVFFCQKKSVKYFCKWEWRNTNI